MNELSPETPSLKDFGFTISKTADSEYIIDDGKLSRRDSPLFNYQTLQFKKPLFVKSGNRGVSYKSPYSMQSILNNNEKFSQFKSLMPMLFHKKSKEMYNEKQRAKSEKELQMYYSSHSQQDVISVVKNFIVPHGREVQKCLERFGAEFAIGTNYLILAESVALSHINRTLDVNRFTDEDYMCKLASDPERTATFAMIFTILITVTSVRKFEEQNTVEPMIRIDSEKITDSAVICLSAMRSQNNVTFDQVLALVLYRVMYFRNDSKSEYSNSMSVLDAIIKMSYRLGIHIQCDHIEEYSETEVRGVWNMIQFIDAVSAALDGTFLHIDYRYCIPRLFDYWEPIILYLRNLVMIFNSVSPISLNEILDLAVSATKIFSVFQPFDLLLSDKVHGSVKYLASLWVKSDFVICYQTLMLSVRLSLDEIDNLSYKPQMKELALVEEMKTKIECQLFHSILLTNGIIKRVISGEISREVERVQFMSSMRVTFSTFMEVNNNMIFAYLSLFSGKKQVKEMKSSRYTDIPLLEAEEILSQDIDTMSLTEFNIQRMVGLMQSFQRLNEYLIDFYISVANRNSVFEDAKFNMHFKFLVFICRLLQNVQEYTQNCQAFGVTLNFDSNDWKKIIDKTVEYFRKNGDHVSTKRTTEQLLENDAFSSEVISPSNNNSTQQFSQISPLPSEFDTSKRSNSLGLENFWETGLYDPSKHLCDADWAFLKSDEIRHSLRYDANNVSETNKYDERIRTYNDQPYVAKETDGGINGVSYPARTSFDEIYRKFFGESSIGPL